MFCRSRSNTMLILAFTVLSFFSATMAAEEFVKANNLFAQSIYKEVANKESGNFLLSPFSAETILALAHSGARGKSADELQNALHLPDKDKVEEALKKLIPSFKGDANLTLQTANKMFVKKDKFTVKDEFKVAANLVYDADVELVDFKKNVETAKAVNSWVEKQTNHKIQNLLSSDDLNELTTLVLVNALYFKANWTKPFYLINSQKKSFYKGEDEVVEVDTMYLEKTYLQYFECPHLNAHFLELPFKGEAKMTIVLPKEKNGLSGIERNLNQVLAPQHQLKREYLNIYLPKFHVETSVDFKSILQNLGVKEIFTEFEADLSGISGEKGDLYINKVDQKTFIDVSENGVEAAAATLIVIAYPEMAVLHEETPKTVKIDHPFLFYITIKDTIVFIGRVTDPSKL